MSQGIYTSSLKEISHVLFTIAQEEQMQWFLEDILTPQEVVEMAERIAICRHLMEWKTQRLVAEELGISVTTVNRWSRILNWSDKRDFILTSS